MLKYIYIPYLSNMWNFRECGARNRSYIYILHQSVGTLNSTKTCKLYVKKKRKRKITFYLTKLFTHLHFHLQSEVVWPPSIFLILLLFFGFFFFINKIYDISILEKKKRLKWLNCNNLKILEVKCYVWNFIDKNVNR